MKKFFVDKEKIRNGEVIIDQEEFLHLSKVLRTKIGENIAVMCGDEFIYFCEIVEMQKRFAKAKIIDKKQCTANPKFNITIFQGLAKGEKLDVITQKLTELGVNTLIPFESDFTIVKNNPLKKERLTKISIEACKQCGRSVSLEICDTIQLKDIEMYLKNFNLVLFLNENADKENTLNKFTNEIIDCENIAIIIGAEGGFSEKENEMLSKLTLKNVSLGNRILRTETASICLASFISFLKNN